MVVGTILGCKKSEQKKQPSPKEIIYVGTFEGDSSAGLYVFEFNREKGTMTQIQTVGNRKGPNFQAIDPTGQYLYSVSGDAFSDSTKNGTISAYKIGQQTGKLTLVNEQSIQGLGPAHVSVGPNGKLAYVSNYGSGSLSVFKINKDGSLSPATQTIQHHGSSVNKERQQAPHVHSVIPAPDGKFVYVSDLGMDKIMIYKVDAVAGKLSPASTPYFASTPGAGPRHLAIHPTGQFAYSAEELSSKVAVLKVNEVTGALTQIQHLFTIPENYEGDNWPADIHVSGDGQFLYVSNRGHNSLAIYRIDASTGKLTPAGYQSVEGIRPRNFMIGRQGEYVFVANLRSDDITIFKRDGQTGKLTFTQNKVPVPQPVCVTQLILD